ncbi:chorismate--pyruvate lyase family protein [Schlegelella aquatica]|uniref:chorismate--pyruvate lyase family protein n=1 Tax=Caldimonas aquatica TaxID=376175 RepID=UPI00375201F4
MRRSVARPRSPGWLSSRPCLSHRPMLRWSACPPATRTLRRWLAAAGSLTAHLKRTSHRFAVEVRRQSGPVGARSPMLALRQGRPLRHLREVALHADGLPLVYACSGVESSARRGPWRALRGLGTRPLAELLFGDGRIRRASMQWCKLPAAHPLGRRADRAGVRGRGPRWARRSVFRQRASRLALMEVFSPSVAERRPLPPPARRR